MKIALVFLISSLAICNAASAVPNYILEAVSDPHRPEADILADGNRKPDQILAFFDLRPGMNVLDVFSGGGYYTELAARVVGATGHVDAHNNAPYVNYIGADKLEARYGEDRLPNVSQLLQDANSLDLAKNHYDRILFILSFHDLYHVDEKNGWAKIDDKVFMQRLLASLKPGGILGIVDHAAPADSGTEVGNTLHRIDPELIRQKMLDWGFKLVGEADFLYNPEDPLNVPMWDPKIRKKTHRVVMKFTK